MRLLRATFLREILEEWLFSFRRLSGKPSEGKYDAQSFKESMNKEEGKITEAIVVDHIIPHRGDVKLFWDQSNWQPLCEHHHNVKTKTEDLYEEYHF